MQRLKTMLNSIDHKGYPAYKGLKGSYDFGDYRLGIDKVQGDPFASPSRISLVVPQSTHAIPKEFYEQKHRRIAVEDHLLRLVCRESEPFNFKAKGSGKSGLIAVSRPGQEIVERSACHINAKNGELTVRMSVGFPANGRSINARELGKIFFRFIPEIVHHACCYANIDAQKLQRADGGRRVYCFYCQWISAAAREWSIPTSNEEGGAICLAGIHGGYVEPSA